MQVISIPNYYGDIPPCSPYSPLRRRRAMIRLDLNSDPDIPIAVPGSQNDPREMLNIERGCIRKVSYNRKLRAMPELVPF